MIVGDVGALVGFAVHHVAPVAPHRADVEQDGLVLALCGGKGLLAPLVPVDGLVHGGAEVGRRGVRERVAWILTLQFSLAGESELEERFTSNAVHVLVDELPRTHAIDPER